MFRTDITISDTRSPNLTPKTIVEYTVKVSSFAELLELMRKAARPTVKAAIKLMEEIQSIDEEEEEFNIDDIPF